MCGDDVGCSRFVQGFEQFHNIERVDAVEVVGGFVGNQQAGLVNDGAGDAQALLFTAGEGYGIVQFSSFQADFFDGDAGTLFGFARRIADNPEQQDDVLQDVAVVEDFVVLEHDADVLAHKADLVVGQCAEILPVKQDFALARLGDARNQLEDGGFA